jgi:tRNA-Thr(GGU) m(6)t(6)A37 methyltransferase TsaA
MQLEPIGLVRTPYVELADAPRQSAVARGVPGRIELATGRHLEDAIADLDRWEHLWVLFWFHAARHYRPKVQPPRSTRRRGVLATRSPHRPNPIGLSLVRLVSVEPPLTLHVLDVDMIDGTPVLDIKPYLPYADLAADASHGWIEPLDACDPEPGYDVEWTAHAAEQLAFLGDVGLALHDAVAQRLSLGPQPHAYRRIRIVGDRYRLAHKDWRFWFVVRGRTLEIERIESGHCASARQTDPELAIHRAFVARYGDAAR